MDLPFARENAEVFASSPSIKEAAESRFTPQQYRVLVKQVYEEKNPSMVGELDFIFSRYEGREEELFSQVCLKYGADKTFLTKDLPPRTELEEGELVEAIVRLEEEHDRRMRLLRCKREEVKELTLLIRLGSERRRCHACDLSICRTKRLIRYAGEICWLAAEESRCAEEEAGTGQNRRVHEVQEDLERGAQWVIKELRAILPNVAQEDPQLAELAHHLSNAMKLQKPRKPEEKASDPQEEHGEKAEQETTERLDCESEQWDPQEEPLDLGPDEDGNPFAQPVQPEEPSDEKHNSQDAHETGSEGQRLQPDQRPSELPEQMSPGESQLANSGAEKLDPCAMEQPDSI